MPVRITINRAATTARVTGAFQSKIGILAEEILNDTNQYCKEDTGILIASSHIHSELDNGKLIWQTPYAKRQYWVIKTAYKTVNPGATWRWCEAAKRNHMDKWQAQAQRLFNGGGQ